MSYIIPEPLNRPELLPQFLFSDGKVEGLDEDITLIAELRTEQEIYITASLSLISVLLLGLTEPTFV